MQHLDHVEWHGTLIERLDLIGVLVGLIGGITGVVVRYRATLRSEEREWRGRATSSSAPSLPRIDDGPDR